MLLLSQLYKFTFHKKTNRMNGFENSWKNVFIHLFFLNVGHVRVRCFNLIHNNTLDAIRKHISFVSVLINLNSKDRKITLNLKLIECVCVFTKNEKNNRVSVTIIFFNLHFGNLKMIGTDTQTYWSLLQLHSMNTNTRNSARKFQMQTRTENTTVVPYADVKLYNKTTKYRWERVIKLGLVKAKI